MSFEKRKRVEDLGLIAHLKRFRCVACNGAGGDVHHVTTRKAGGDDVPNNLMPLCRGCHTKVHQIGYGKMIDLHPGVGAWLETAGRTDVLERVARFAR